MLILRKKRLVKHTLITNAAGEVKMDRVLLPDSALAVVGVRASAKHLAVPMIPVSSLHYRYGSVALGDLTAADALNLTVGTYVDNHPIFSTSAPSDSGKYVFFAYPISLNTPRFVYQGFEGGFLDRGTITFNTADGVQIFRVFRSTNPNLGDDVTIQVFQ